MISYDIRREDIKDGVRILGGKEVPQEQGKQSPTIVFVCGSSKYASNDDPQ